MKQIKALIVDDERLARQELKTLLQEYPQILISGEAGGLEEAMQRIRDNPPDVIFLDIQLSGQNGFDLLGRATVQADVVFVTAYDEYAIRAFEVSALDYLLKPVNPKRLATTMSRLLSAGGPVDNRSRQLDYADSVILRLNRTLRLFKVGSIVCIQAEGDYSKIVTSQGLSGLVLRTMKEWEGILPDKYFIRIHRSTIANCEFIDRIEERQNYAYNVHMKGIMEPLVMSRRYAVNLKGMKLL